MNAFRSTFRILAAITITLQLSCGTRETVNSEPKAVAIAATYVVVKGGTAACLSNPFCQFYVIGTATYAVYKVQEGLQPLVEEMGERIVYMTQNYSDLDNFLDAAANAVRSATNWFTGEKGATLVLINSQKDISTSVYVRSYASMALCERAKASGSWINPAQMSESSQPVNCRLAACACVPS